MIMAQTYIPTQGLMLDGTIDRATAITAAHTHLTDAGVSAAQANDACLDRPGFVVYAWWGGDDIGFCQENYPAAAPVTVVHISLDA